MNIRHLGDALDHWKGCIIRLLEGELNDLYVVPMFTDENPEETWTDCRLRLYAYLLGLSTRRDEADVTRILRRDRRFTAASRQDYFANIETADGCDLFLDPDTGIAPPSGGNTRHVRVEELGQLLPNSTRRVVLCYQHSSREDNWVDACVQRVTQDQQYLASCFAFAYWAGTASMVFVSRARDRLKDMHDVLDKLVAPLPDDLGRRLTAISPE